MDYSFNCEIAAIYGVDEAIFIHNIYWWIAKNEANGRHYYEGRNWTYNSMEAFSRLFPFWTIKQIRRIIKNLKDNGALLTGTFNQSKYDRTQWYSLSDEINRFYRNDNIHLPKRADDMCPNGQMSSAQTGTPIPDNKPYSKPDKENILVEAKTSTPPPAITLTLNDKSEYPIYQQQVEEWSALYPAVDVMQELREMRGWLGANPQRRKTSRGILRFIALWLAKEQDKGRCAPSRRKEKWLE